MYLSFYDVGGTYKRKRCIIHHDRLSEFPLKSKNQTYPDSKIAAKLQDSKNTVGCTQAKTIHSYTLYLYQSNLIIVRISEIIRHVLWT